MIASRAFEVLPATDLAAWGEWRFRDQQATPGVFTLRVASNSDPSVTVLPDTLPSGVGQVLGISHLVGTKTTTVWRNLDGPQGNIGAPGIPGDVGASTGPQGPMGPQGYQGAAAGTQGPMGAQGPPGATGPTGFPGGIGPTGPSGDRGSQGTAGPQGSSVGPQGAQGPAGAAGSAGPAGARGAQGATGPQGAPGADITNTVSAGQGIDVLSGGPNYTVGFAEHAIAAIEFVDTHSAGQSYVAITGLDHPATTMYGNLRYSVSAQLTIGDDARGPTGPPGVSGAAGGSGSSVTGPQGYPGADGAAGAPGPTPTVDSPTVSGHAVAAGSDPTASADISVSGSTVHFTFAFGLPTGAQGTPGSGPDQATIDNLNNQLATLESTEASQASQIAILQSQVNELNTDINILANCCGCGGQI